jgi:hypothetical protein
LNFSFPSDPGGLVVYLIGLLILWIIVSIPVYFAGKLLKGGRASFGSALGATLGGVVVYYVVVFVVAFFLGAVIGSSVAGALALVLGLLAWLAVYRSAFDTSWLGAIGIVIVAWLILLVLDFLLRASFNVSFPDFFPF